MTTYLVLWLLSGVLGFGIAVWACGELRLKWLNLLPALALLGGVTLLFAVILLIGDSGLGDRVLWKRKP